MLKFFLYCIFGLHFQEAIIGSSKTGLSWTLREGQCFFPNKVLDILLLWVLLLYPIFKILNVSMLTVSRSEFKQCLTIYDFLSLPVWSKTCSLRRVAVSPMLLSVQVVDRRLLKQTKSCLCFLFLSSLILNWELPLVLVKTSLTSCYSSNLLLCDVFINFIKIIPWSPLYGSFKQCNFIR